MAGPHPESEAHGGTETLWRSTTSEDVQAAAEVVLWGQAASEEACIVGAEWKPDVELEELEALPTSKRSIRPCKAVAGAG